MATSYLSPGVYVEEVDRGAKPIEAVGTNTVGFLGESARGPVNEAVLITNWSTFVKTFGDFGQASTHLAHAVYGFFNNGGSRWFDVNVLGAQGEAAANPAAAQAKEGEKKEAAKPAGKVDRDALFIGKDNGPGQRTGLKCFDEIDEIALVAVPGVISPAVQDAVLTHCEVRKDRFAILDSPETINGGVDRLSRPRDSKYGAYYFPWIQVYDPEKGYINVRRLFIMVETSIERATQWVVFEPNDHRLWKRVTRTISSFLTLLHRNGALMGETVDKAFFVKCDAETNPPEVIDAGQLIVEIGLAPVKPAEFVIFR